MKVFICCIGASELKSKNFVRVLICYRCDSIRFCNRCGGPFILMPFRDRAKISIAGNIAFFGLGYYFGRKMKKYCPGCR